MITELCRLIIAVQNDDKALAISYAQLLADNLDKCGQHTEANRVRRALGNLPPSANTVTLDILMPLRPPDYNYKTGPAWGMANTTDGHILIAGSMDTHDATITRVCALVCSSKCASTCPAMREQAPVE